MERGWGRGRGKRAKQMSTDHIVSCEWSINCVRGCYFLLLCNIVWKVIRKHTAYHFVNEATLATAAETVAKQTKKQKNLKNRIKKKIMCFFFWTSLCVPYMSIGITNSWILLVGSCKWHQKKEILACFLWLSSISVKFI